MDWKFKKQLTSLKRTSIKTIYESILLLDMRVNAIRTDLELKNGIAPLTVPIPKVEKADKIEKIIVAVKRHDPRYENSMSIDYQYHFHPLCNIANVVFFDIGKFTKIGKRKMNAEFLEVIKKEDPDLVFSCIFKDELFPKTIREISENSRTITCNWFADDHWRFDYFGRYYAPHFNFCVTVDELSLDKYRRLGYENILMSQWGANTELYHKIDGIKQDIGATFVGQNYSNRKELFDKLQKNKIEIQRFGAGWDSEWVSFEKMIEIYNRSKINLNFSNSALGPTKQIKSRIFDIPACGGFLLTEYAPGLEKYYKIGKEIEVFEGINDAVEKINYYLNNEEERRKITERGYQRTIKEHLYEDRYKKLFKEILTKI
ncbi:glycosyltransferase [Candidatus Micrarchaeota archaeon]|nr:glycosyltransferase [Candidatus Micrarchaeota archaeon]